MDLSCPRSHPTDLFQDTVTSPSEGGALASSPRSSTSTSHGTPSTNLTAFTPKAAPGTIGGKSSVEVKHRPKNIVVGKPIKYVSNIQEAILYELSFSSSSDDVFLSAPTPTTANKLSPTAEVFTPGTQSEFDPFSIVSGPYTQRTYLRSQELDDAALCAGVRNLLRDSTPDEEDCLTENQTFTPGVIGTPTAGNFSVDPLVVHTNASIPKKVRSLVSAGPYLHSIDISEGVFSTDEQLTRAFMVANLPRDWPASQIAEAFNVSVCSRVLVILC